MYILHFYLKILGSVTILGKQLTSLSHKLCEDFSLHVYEYSYMPGNQGIPVSQIVSVAAASLQYLFKYLNSFLFKICILNTLKYFSFDLFVSAISRLPLPRG